MISKPIFLGNVAVPADGWISQYHIESYYSSIKSGFEFNTRHLIAKLYTATKDQPGVGKSWNELRRGDYETFCAVSTEWLVSFPFSVQRLREVGIHNRTFLNMYQNWLCLAHHYPVDKAGFYSPIRSIQAQLERF